MEINPPAIRDAGAVENGVLQGPHFRQSLFAPDFRDDLRRDGVAVEKSAFLPWICFH